jgi:hypothetical protein
MSLAAAAKPAAGLLAAVVAVGMFTVAAADPPPSAGAGGETAIIALAVDGVDEPAEDAARTPSKKKRNWSRTPFERRKKLLENPSSKWKRRKKP